MCCRFAFIGSCLLVARVLCSEQRAVEVVSALRDAADLVEKGLLTVEEYRDIKRDLMVPLKYGATEGSMQKLPKFFGTALAAHTLQPRTELTVLDYQVLEDTLLLSHDLLRHHPQQSKIIDLVVLPVHSMQDLASTMYLRVPRKLHGSHMNSSFISPWPPLFSLCVFCVLICTLCLQVQGDDGATLTLFQYLGEKRDGFNDTRIRYYIDGEQNASIDYL